MMRPINQHDILLSAVIVLAALLASPVAAFVSPRQHKHNAVARNGPPSLSILLASNNANNAISEAKVQIEQSLTNTDRGRSISTPQQRTRIHSLLSNLETLCPLSEPARDPKMEGSWIVLYTDAPPPSNGQLGFLKGIAKQVIDLDGGRYRNELYVGGNGVDDDEGAWLTAVLDAKWEEWDGIYLDDDDDENESSSNIVVAEEDAGATTWKVDFESLTLSLFEIPIFTQQFKKGTSRTWKMTYLDNDTRIVRAGKTGRGEDDWLFYMRRGVGGGSASL